MKYFGYMPNDTINGIGISVSIWTSGCPFRCKNCQNPETWNPNNGYNIPKDIVNKIIKAISANGIQRNISFLGGEPLYKKKPQPKKKVKKKRAFFLIFFFKN